MKFYCKQKAIEIINQYQKQKENFLFVIDFEMDKIIVEKISNIDSNELLFDFEGFSNKKNIEISKKIDFETEKIDFERYKNKFDFVLENILAGNTYLLNLTERIGIKSSLDLKNIFYLSNAKYKLWLNDEFVFFSPEIFVKIKDNKISSFPMKGTIDANIKNAEDIILHNEKELAEHYTIVDLIRNDLSIVATNVDVKRFRYIDRLKTSRNDILQVSSEISGNVRENIGLGDLIFSLLPAGSISGAPKKKTVEIIQDIEKIKRGYYTGVSGIFDGENLNSCVNIRFIEKDNGNFFYRSGGGITFKSNVEEEYKEVTQKVYIAL